jgi:hypothetical protein
VTRYSSLQTCQGSGVGSIPIGRSIKSSIYRLCFLSVGKRACFHGSPNHLNHFQVPLHASRALEPVHTRLALVCCSRGPSVP